MEVSSVGTFTAILFAGTSNAGVFKSIDGGGGWQPTGTD